jgi:hypothetical protein
MARVNNSTGKEKDITVIGNLTKKMGRESFIQQMERSMLASLSKTRRMAQGR